MSFDENKPVFTIGVAATASGLHPQTLRLYEARGYVIPARTPGGTRMYSMHDVESLMHIAELTAHGIGGDGIAMVLDLEQRIDAQNETIDALLGESRRLKALLMRERIENDELRSRSEYRDKPSTAIIVRAKTFPLSLI